MAKKVREITITDEGGAFSAFFKKFSSESEYDFEGMSALRKLLSNEKAKILHTIKTKNPASLYDLAKLLRRDFKSVHADVKLLERFGFIDMVAEKSGKRNRLRPIIVIDSLYIHIKI